MIGVHMKLKHCIRCDILGAQVTFAIFPLDSFRWCSDKCLLLWCKEHNVVYDGEIVDRVEKRKTKEIIKLEDVA